MNAEQITMNTDMVGYAKRFAGIKGFFAAFIMSSSAVGLPLIFPNNQWINLACIILIPLIVAFYFLNNFIHALTLTWLNEVFFGIGGMWIKVGTIPGRGLLLLIVLLIYVITRPNVISNIDRHNKNRWIVHKRDCWIVFYGIIFPIILLVYSVIIRGNAFSNALADVQRFIIILIFFPLRDVIHRHFGFVLGWLAGATVALSLLFVSLAIAPDDFRIALLERWVYSFSDGDESYSAAAVLSSGRAFFTPLILCWIGVFFGFIRILDLKLKTIKRLESTLLLTITSAAFVVNFARGPIVAIFIVFILLAIVVSGFKREQIIRGVTIFFAFIIMLSTGYIVTVTYLPIALTKWDMDGMTFEQAIDPVRIEQTEVMLNAWLEEPILGQGVGNIISGYARHQSGLAFEVQYPMILYRSGIVGFCFIMTPFLWIMVRTVRRIKQIPELFNSDKGKLLLTMACSVCAILVASLTNPFLASSMTFIFVALFLAIDSSLPIMRRRKNFILI